MLFHFGSNLHDAQWKIVRLTDQRTADSVDYGDIYAENQNKQLAKMALDDKGCFYSVNNVFEISGVKIVSLKNKLSQKKH